MCEITAKPSNKRSELELFQFSDLKKPVEVSFTAPNLSSFGGLTLLKSVNKHQNFIHRQSAHVSEWRNEHLLAQISSEGTPIMMTVNNSG